MQRAAKARSPRRLAWVGATLHSQRRHFPANRGPAGRVGEGAPGRVVNGHRLLSYTSECALPSARPFSISKRTQDGPSLLPIDSCSHERSGSRNDHLASPSMLDAF